MLLRRPHESPHAQRRPKPKLIGPAASLAQAAEEYERANSHNPNVKAALKALVQDHSGKVAAQITADDVQRAAQSWRTHGYAQHTRANYSKCLRRFLRWLERVAGARPTISEAVPRVLQPAARTVIATDEERRQLLEAATPALRFFLLLCADLGIRHRTAARITPANYNPSLRAVSFYTKGDTHQTLPVTAEIAATFAAIAPTADRNAPVVNLLRAGNRVGTRPGKQPRFTKQWKKLKEKCGIRPDLRIHDLRRTVAEDVWEATHDLRSVQAQLGHRSPVTTAKYLADRIALPELQIILAKVEDLRLRRALARAQKAEPQRYDA